jgi:RNA polymerase sigma-70 factor (ECF subfamily)
VPISESEAWRDDSLAAYVARAQAGDREAFEHIYRMHVGRVYSICARMSGSRAAAEELTQDVFVRAWQKLRLFRGESAFSTWLHRLAVNVVLTARKAEARRQRWLEKKSGEQEEVVDSVTAPGRSTAAAMDLEAAIAQLPDGARRVFVLHDVEGYKHEEIAAMLGITVGGSKSQLHRARLLLREALQR